MMKVYWFEYEGLFLSKFVTNLVMRSNPAHELSFIFQLENMVRSNLNLSTSYGGPTDIKSLFGLLLVSFIWHGEKISLKYSLIGGGGGRLSFMSRQCRHRLCPNWLSQIFYSEAFIWGIIFFQMNDIKLILFIIYEALDGLEVTLTLGALIGKH